jgi:chromosome partitioning protein
MRMLNWFRRIATPAPHEQLVKNENQTPPLEDRVERLVGQPGTTANELGAGLTQMRVIVVASQKGGAGKTTIAAHLAVRAGMVGQGPAVLVDTDPQGSLREWRDARKHNDKHARNDDAPAFATVKLDDLTTKLAELRGHGAAVAIIDTPPALTASIEQVMAIADLVLIPARPSPHDLRAIGATVNMTRRARKPYLFVINGAMPRANITAEAVAALSEHGRVAPIVLYQRTDYAVSMIDGRTVMETAATGRSSQEIAELWKYIHAQISIRAAA